MADYDALVCVKPIMEKRQFEKDAEQVKNKLDEVGKKAPKVKVGIEWSKEEQKKAEAQLEAIFERKRKENAEVVPGTSEWIRPECEFDYDAAVAAQSLINEQIEAQAAAMDKISEKEARIAEKEAEKAAKLATQEKEQKELLHIQQNAVVSNHDLVDLLRRQEAIAQRMVLLKRAGVGAGYQEYDMLAAEQEQIKKQIDFQQNGFAKIEKSGRKCFKAIQNGAKKSNNLFSTMASRLKGIMLSLLVFNWISKGFNAMVSSMKEGFQNLSKYSAEYNEQMSALKSSATQTKNALAAAFEPEVNVVIPYLVQMIQWLNVAIDKVGQFFAVLNGSNTYTRAKKQNIDYAKSLDTASKSAQRALASFDELNVLSKESGGASAGGELTGADAFEEVEIDDKTAKAFQVAVEKARELFEPLKRLYEDLKTGDFLGAGQDISDFISGLLDFFADGIDKVDWDDVGGKIGELLKGIEWTRVLRSGGNFFESLVDAAIDLWVGAFETAPFETGLATALALIVWSGVPGIEVCGTSLGKALAASAVAAFIGFNIGEKIAEKIDPDSFKFYEDVKNSEGGIWGYLTSDLESALDGLCAMLMDYQNPASGLALGLVNAILGPFVSLPLSMARCAKMAFDGIGLSWEDFSKWWDDTGFANWFEGVQDSFDKDKWTFEGIKEGLETAWESGTNAAKEIWNNFVENLNEFLTWEIEPVEVMGRTVFEGTTISLGKFPMLADGAVIPGGRPFAAILGDQRAGQTNIETPLPTMVQAFKQTISEMGGAGNGTCTFVAQLDGETIFQETVRWDQMQYDATGVGAFQH